MKRITPKSVLSIFCCSALMSGAYAPAFAQVVRLGAGASGAPGAAAAASATPALISPALPGGASSLGSLSAASLPAAAAPVAAALPAAAAPIAAAASAAIPAARAAALPARAAAADGPKAPGDAVPGADKPSSLGSAKDLSGRVTPGEGEQAGSDKAADVSNQAFDGTGAAPEAPMPVAANGTPLNRLYPNVVFIQDVFSAPAPDAVAEHINRLIADGVHVVFMTWRPQKGPGSAEEILLSRVKQSRNNPVVVVAFNGGKIALHGRAANPKAIMENVGQFSEENVAKIKAIAAQIGAGGAEAVTASPADKEAFSLTVNVDGAQRAAILKKLNVAMKDAGLPYKAEKHEDDANALIIHSMPLRFSLPRVIDALESQFPGENIAAQPEKYLVVADSMKSLRFSTSFPKLAEVQVAGDAAGVGAVLGAVLGDNQLETVSLKLGKLRQYVEFWEPSRHFVPGADSEGSGGGGGRAVGRPQDKETSQKMAMFVGTIINRLMAKIYENIRNGQHQFTATPWALQKQLEEMWRKPIENGVYVNKQLAAVLATIPGEVKRGYLERASAYVSNFYARELASYPAAAAHVELNLVSLNTDRKSSITLEFKSNATGKVYKIYTRIPRVMRQRTGDGVTLTAYAYRTGKEVVGVDEAEEFLSRVYAMALLKGHARMGTDGKWHHGNPDGPEITKLVVQFERHSSARIKVYTPSTFDMLEQDGMMEGPIVRELTSAIERMEADGEYQQYYLEHEVEAKAEDLKKPAAPKKKAAKPAAKTAAAKKPAVKKGPAARGTK